MKRIAILGGTFNPIHNGHLKLAENACSQYPIDEFWFMPAPNPPHKAGRVITDYSHRLKMTELAIAGNTKYVCSDFESRRSGKSYTSDTLTELTSLYPDDEFSFVIGADSFYEIETWHEPETVMRLASLIVADRDYDANHASLSAHAEHLTKAYGARVRIVRAGDVDISSERLRQMLRRPGLSKSRVVKYLPAAVFDYIRAHGLYLAQEAEA